MLALAFPDGLQGKSIVDLGCLEGGHITEFARLGMRALGVEARKSNFANCMTVKAAVDLPGLSFVHDTVWNAAKYGPFDAVWCCGLLYHLDRPREFIRMMSAACRKIMILHTHFSMTQDKDTERWKLSAMTENEGLAGRRYHEHDGQPPEQLETIKWGGWENQRSFWPRAHVFCRRCTKTASTAFSSNMIGSILRSILRSGILCLAQHMIAPL